MRDQLVVTNGSRTEVVTVEERVSDYAYVVSASAEADTESTASGSGAEEGDTLSGWVEVPDNPAEPKHVLLCEECGREETDLDEDDGPLRKEHVCNHRGTAELQASIHETLTGHEPSIETRAP